MEIAAGLGLAPEELRLYGTDMAKGARPADLDVKINGAYITLGLLYGQGDVRDTLIIATRAGQDSECNPSSALGMLGVVLGYDVVARAGRAGGVGRLRLARSSGSCTTTRAGRGP